MRLMTESKVVVCVVPWWLLTVCDRLTMLKQRNSRTSAEASCVLYI